VLRGELVDLRAVERSDAALIHGWLDDPELMRWWGFGVSAVSLAAVQLRIEQWVADEVTWGHPVAFIGETLEGAPVGMVVLSDMQPVDRTCELSLFINKSKRGSGLGGDAIETILDAVCGQWNLHRVTARSEAANKRAHDFFIRHGFQPEGRLREARFIDGGWSDILIFGRVCGEEPLP
jgi:RimJ/RimL family protein N-acetyltransferase